MSYVIITGTFNEEIYIVKTLLSVIKQTVLPKRWIIVNDGSTDKTEEIVLQYSTKHDWIRLINQENKNLEFGTHAVMNFNKGLQYVSDIEYEFIIKLDADLDIDRNDYFEYQITKFKENPKLGISSGITYYIMGKGKKIAYHPWWQTTGAMKMYRKACLVDIGGLVPILGWDGLDTYMAMYRGWETRTFYDLEVNHLGKAKDILRRRKPNFYIKQGISYNQRGYSLLFTIIKFLNYIMKIGPLKALSFIKGYLKGYTYKKVVSKNEIKLIRKFQRRRLLMRSKYA